MELILTPLPYHHPPPTPHGALPASAGDAGKSPKPLIDAAATTLLRRSVMNLCLSQIYFGEGRGEDNGRGVQGGGIIRHHAEFTTRTSMAGPLLLLYSSLTEQTLAGPPHSGLFCFFFFFFLCDERSKL